MARHANEMAQRLQSGIAALGYPFPVASPTNQQFPVLPNTVARQLEALGYAFEAQEPVDDSAYGCPLCDQLGHSRRGRGQFLKDLAACHKTPWKKRPRVRTVNTRALFTCRFPGELLQHHCRPGPDHKSLRTTSQTLHPKNTALSAAGGAFLQPQQNGHDHSPRDLFAGRKYLIRCSPHQLPAANIRRGIVKPVILSHIVSGIPLIKKSI